MFAFRYSRLDEAEKIISISRINCVLTYIQIKYFEKTLNSGISTMHMHTVNLLTYLLTVNKCMQLAESHTAR